MFGDRRNVEVAMPWRIDVMPGKRNSEHSHRLETVV